MDKIITCSSKLYIDEYRKEHSFKWSCSSTESSSFISVWLVGFLLLSGWEGKTQQRVNVQLASVRFLSLFSSLPSSRGARK